MLNLNSIMLGSTQPKVLIEFYEKVFEKKPDMVDGSWAGWSVGASFFAVGEHSEMKGMAKEAGRILFNFETPDVKGQFKRIADLKAKIIKAPYDMGTMWIATFADPDGNYFQLMSPWKE